VEQKDPSSPIQQKRLDSWKAIAIYLGRSSRTVQRWHVEFGLPIHRLGGNTGSVFTFTDELDDWMRVCGRTAAEKPSAFAPPPTTLMPHSHRILETGNEVRDLSGISDQEKARSAEAVALARQMWQVLSYGNLAVIARCFRRAIDLDPVNADAFAGLSFAMIVEGLWGLVPPPVAYNAARIAARRALEIDAEQPEALSAICWLKMLADRDWRGASRALDEVLRLEPQSRRARIGRALLHIAEGDLQKASGLLLIVALQNTLSSPTMAWYCRSEYLAGGSAHAIHQIHQYRLSGRSGPVVDAIEAMASIQLEEPDAQIERIESLLAASPHHEVLRGALGYAYGAAGYAQEANEVLNKMMRSDARQRKHEPYALALALIGLNRKREAVQQLEQSYRDGSIWSLGFLSDPILDTLRNDSNFLLFLSKVTYPVAEETALLIPSVVDIEK